MDNETHDVSCQAIVKSNMKYEDSNPLDTSNKLIELSIAPNDLVNSFSRLVVVNGCNEEAKNEDNNDEEDVVAIRAEPIEFVIANVDKPSLDINCTICIPSDLAMFDVHNVLDDRWNQLIVGYFGKAYPLELVQRWEEMSSILSTCSYAKLIDKGIIDLLRELGQAILILTWYLFPPDQFGLEFPFEVWDPGRHLLVNSYISKIIKNKIHGVDISDILLQTDKSDTSDSPDEGSYSFWFCLHPTTHDLTLVPLEPLSSYFTITGGQSLFIESSVGYSCNASKGLYIAGEVHLLVLYANFDAKPEDIVQEPPSVNDDQQSSHKSLFPRHIGDVHFYYVAESAKRTDSAFFLLASTELVFMKRFLIEKDFHVLPVKMRESYNADGLLVCAPYADVHEDAKHRLENDSKLPWTYHTLCHVYQSEFCYKEAILSEANCSTPWSPLSFFNSTHNEGRIALCYTKKTRMKLTCSITDVFLPSYLVEQMVVPWIGSNLSQCGNASYSKFFNTSWNLLHASRSWRPVLENTTKKLPRAECKC
ncbi:hypothetical protein KY290_036941 [Solanum tuberosum]|uniref:Uncharacterized protein n=1 Tax=Solanum tuberosum TaxID=4113 RepID=A0ABQ7TU33_SOLTU|nr:hypothetical protein KY290_036941 [Solanum tuberosum]